MGKQYFGCGSPLNFFDKLDFFTPFLYSLTDFSNIATKRIVKTCSRPVYFQISNLKKKCIYSGNLQK